MVQTCRNIRDHAIRRGARSERNLTAPLAARVIERSAQHIADLRQLLLFNEKDGHQFPENFVEVRTNPVPVVRVVEEHEKAIARHVIAARGTMVAGDEFLSEEAPKAGIAEGVQQHGAFRTRNMHAHGADPEAVFAVDEVDEKPLVERTGFEERGAVKHAARGHGDQRFS